MAQFPRSDYAQHMHKSRQPHRIKCAPRTSNSSCSAGFCDTRLPTPPVVSCIRAFASIATTHSCACLSSQLPLGYARIFGSRFFRDGLFLTTVCEVTLLYLPHPRSALQRRHISSTEHQAAGDSWSAIRACAYVDGSVQDCASSAPACKAPSLPTSGSFMSSKPSADAAA